MNRFISICLISLSFPAFGLTFQEAGAQSFLAIQAGLQKCGLVEMNAYDPRLPRPQVPADTAIVNKRGRVLAYYIQFNNYGTTQILKNPNGGMVHSVTYSREHIQWVTPLAGTIAHGNRFMTVGGPGYNLYCRSVPVLFPAFQACVQQGFVDVVVAQLCANAEN